MIQHSESVDKQLTGSGLASTVGKHWVLDEQLQNKPNLACNYGWHFTGASFQGIKGFLPATMLGGPNTRVIQPNATAHDPHHVDYSQICQLISQQCWIDGTEMRFEDVIKDPKYAPSVSHQGALKIDRQPGVPKIQGQLVLMPTDLTGENNANV